MVDYLRQGSADGALAVSIQADDPLPQMLLDARVPVVLFARPPQPLPVSYVDMDHCRGGRLAAEHLLARGRRHLAAISAPRDLPAGRDGLAGFRAGRGPSRYSPGLRCLSRSCRQVVRLTCSVMR